MPTDQYVPPKPRCGYRSVVVNGEVLAKNWGVEGRVDYICACPTGEHVDGVMCIDDPARCSHVRKWEGGGAPTAALIHPVRRKPGITKRRTITKEERHSGHQRSAAHRGEGD